MKWFPRSRKQWAALPLISQRKPFPFLPFARSWAGLVLEFGTFIYLINVYIVSALCQMQMLRLSRPFSLPLPIHHPAEKMTELRRPAGPETQHLCCLPPSLAAIHLSWEGSPIVLEHLLCGLASSTSPPLTSWPPQHSSAQVLSAGPWGLVARDRHSLLETHTPGRADRAVSPPGSESQPWLCSYLSQVRRRLMGRNSREGFPGTSLGSWLMWERA